MYSLNSNPSCTLFSIDSNKEINPDEGMYILYGTNMCTQVYMCAFVGTALLLPPIILTRWHLLVTFFFYIYSHGFNTCSPLLQLIFCHLPQPMIFVEIPPED